MSQNVAKLIEDLIEDMNVYVVDYEMGIRGEGVEVIDSDIFLAYTLEHALKAAKDLVDEFIKDNKYDFYHIVGVKQLNDGPVWVRTDGDDWSEMLDGALETYQQDQTSIKPVAI